MDKITIRRLEPSNKDYIRIIANWYFEEWNTPIEKTFSRLENQPGEDVLFQLVATKEDQLIATVGLGNKVNLIKVHKRYEHLKPWVALLYTQEADRKQGVGQLLLEEINRQAKAIALKEIYLYTFTAESLYTKCGWKEIDRAQYKGHDTVIMKKQFE